MDLKQGDLENLILNALWDLEETGHVHVFVSDIQARIQTPQRRWAYTTVKTVLDRLVDKAMAKREKEGKKFYYATLLNRDEASVDALKKVLRQYFQNDLDELLSCISKLREQGVGMRTAIEAGLVNHDGELTMPQTEAISLQRKTPVAALS
jgi:predicted transcriptional regulator